jgi:hypothetical protein
MRWLRLLASIPLVLAGLLVLYAGVRISITVASYWYDESIKVLIILLCMSVGMAVGGLVIAAFGVRTIFRSLTRHSVAKATVA